MGQNRLDLGLAHAAGMVQVMKANAASDSARISRFGSAAIVQVANLLTQLIHQPG